MKRLEKQTLVDELGEKLRKAQLVVLADFTGLSVEKMNRLRRQLEAADSVEFQVTKNTLCGRAVQDGPLQGLTPFLVGPTAVVVGLKDPVSPAKVLNDFVKENEKFKIKAGYFGGQLIRSDDLKALASLPPREVLQGQLLATLQAPLSQFVGVLAAAPQKLLGVLEAQRASMESPE